MYPSLNTCIEEQIITLEAIYVHVHVHVHNSNLSDVIITYIWE